MLKVTAIPNYLPLVDKPFMVHTVSREVITFAELIDRMAEGRTSPNEKNIKETRLPDPVSIA